MRWVRVSEKIRREWQIPRTDVAIRRPSRKMRLRFAFLPDVLAREEDLRRWERQSHGCPGTITARDDLRTGGLSEVRRGGGEGGRGEGQKEESREQHVVL